MAHGHKPFTLTQRVATIGPMTVLDVEFNVDTWIQCADERPYYQVNVLVKGQMELAHRDALIHSGPGRANICLPEGPLLVKRWAAGSRMIALRIDRSFVEDTVIDVLEREVGSQINFAPLLVTAEGAARSWLNMFVMLTQDVFRPESALTDPLVSSSFANSLMRTLLIAADHPYRAMLAEPARHVAPRVIRAAVDIIEAHPELPLTVDSLASRCNVSARTLQQGFQRHLDTSPMEYLRQVRLRRAHQHLLASDPSEETVASIAKRWGYTNPGRFAAAHANRYGETPAATLRKLP